MQKEEVWDIYFSKLHELLVSERNSIEQLIEKETKTEISRRWKDIDEEDTRVYVDTAISFIDERLYAYGLDHVDRALKAITCGGSLADLASIERSLSWYDLQQEKEEIDGKIETGLNLMLSEEDIVDDLLDEFGAFPDRSIIQQYQFKPKKNYLPDYALAIAIQQAIGERRS